MRSITASVGQGCTNLRGDVGTVQELLNQAPPAAGGPQVPLKVDGLAWGKTVAAIRRFQSLNLGHKWPDGRVDPRGATMAALNKYDQKGQSAKELVYYVGGKKVVVAQKTINVCWAAVYTMLRSWREGKTYEVVEALEKPGKQYVEMYEKDWPLPPAQFRDFWVRGGLTVRGNAYFADHIWYDFLKQHGLLAVGSANSLPPAPGLHLRILEGIHVTGADSDRYLIIDPGLGGQKYPERAFDFEAKYNLAMTVGPGAHWQVAHYY